MSVENQIRKFLYENFIFADQIKIDNDASLLDNGIIDSTGVLELIMFIEDTFRIEIQDEEVIPKNLDSINNLVKFIQHKMPSGQSC